MTNGSPLFSDRAAVRDQEWKSVLFVVAKEMGVSKRVLLSSILLEFMTLPKSKQLEMVGDYFAHSSSSSVTPEGGGSREES